MPASTAQRISAFSYGFHFEESLRAILVTGNAAPQALTAAIIPLLAQPSPSTRLRLAQKIVQRYFTPADAPTVVKTLRADSPFLRLVRGIRQTETQRELLYYQCARTDALVGAMARGLFHHHFVARKVPRGFSAEEFRVVNAGALFNVRGIMSADFAVAYARRQWDFQHPTVVRRALHLLEEAGVVRKVKLTELKQHPLAYAVAPRALSLPSFLFAVYDEFAPNARPIALRRLTRARFARTFVLWPEQVRHLAAAAARHRFIKLKRSRTSMSLRLQYGSLDRLVEAVLERYGARP